MFLDNLNWVWVLVEMFTHLLTITVVKRIGRRGRIRGGGAGEGEGREGGGERKGEEREGEKGERGEERERQDEREIM